LHWRENELTFQLGVISYINTSPIEFEVQLKGYDTIPWQLSGHSLVRYTNLSPGRYTFLAKARGDGGNWGNAVNLEIFITSPYWKRWWFFALVILLLMAIGAAVSFLVSDRKMKLQALELEKQKELEKERQRISREMHDDIGAGLTRITLMADMIARKQEGISEVKEISGTSRKLVGSMREIIWTMNPENGTLERLFAYLRETFKSQVEYSGIEGRVSFPDKPPDMILNNEQLHHIILVCREAVNNAICHSGCKNILLQSGIKDNSLWFCIMDDGKGLPETDTKRGNGLRNMKSRIAELGGEFLLETGVNRGTSIRFFIPLHA
jgi:signal transduction histidine kinase